MDNKNAAAPQDAATSGLVANTIVGDIISAPLARFDVECVGSNGEVKWTDTAHNIVTTGGKQHVLDVTFGAGTPADWYIILAGAGTKAAADTLASHAGWTEITAYTGNRPAITFGAATVVSTTGAQVTNTGGTPVAFAITGSATVAGAGASSAATGTSGVLYNVGDFSASRTVASGDTLNVTITLSLAA